MKIVRKTTLSIILLSALLSCKNEGKDTAENEKLNIVTTTTMITDLVKNIGGDLVEVNGLMGAGVDPHLYKASEGDVNKLYTADIIFYNGLHLEGKLVEVFEKMERTGKTQVALAESLDKSGLIGSDYFASNYDPHVWFNIEYFKQFAGEVTETLVEKDPKNASKYAENEAEYIQRLTQLETEVKAKIETLPKEKRILVTAHDAFNYFGKAYNFEVVGLQGLSTATEAGVQDVQRISQFIIDNNVKAIFVESSVPRRTIEALQQSVKSKGQDVKIGGSLYSDALGSARTEEGTYIGMFKHNVNTIINELK
ncbi:metal ABC transporter solute-binding protein, Zn/Mn family [Marinirhabdus gelatinilytica]|uniref:Manganese/zinc/iron transport system substrate-binding protein n=1 Tax=Marinirhabdus gelatinilytica TaxID=1703343 RepID=A0A370QJ72_9FLAO|nr:zinc ABC transporter substrate-binding protein [Marinirhabdus gelatinilytica]RDK88391.1 manganese/zinc/iron transport system substrate-binding protein [Marinirhabdus gelatinilytica]